MPVTQPTAAEITSGPSILRVAPLGTALPNVVGSPATFPPTWPAGWTQVGYTDKGVELITTPTIKPYTPDEERSPVYDIPEAEKAEISAILAQAILDNYHRSVSASTLTDDTTSKVRTLAYGNLPLTYLMIGIQGPTPVDPDGGGTNVGDGVICIFRKAIAMAPITFGMTRQNVRLFNVKWEARKIAGQDLYDLYEYYH